MPLDTHPQLAIYAPLIEECAATYSLDPVIVGAIILKESSGNPNAYNSRYHASGLMQVVPREAGPVFADRPTSAELMKPEVGIEWGCRILAGYLARKNGDYFQALKLYAGYSNKPDEEFQVEYWSVVQGYAADIREDGQSMATTTERFIKAAEAEFGGDFEDLRANPKTKDQGRGFRWIDSRTMPYIVIHHSTGSVTTTAQTIWNHHVKTNGWAGIGYHLLIRLPPKAEHAQVQLVGDLDTQRAHVLNNNHLGLGICMAGNFDTRPDVPPPMVNALKRLIRVLDEVYGAPKELRWHAGPPLGILAASYTACPGSALKRIIPSLRSDVPSKMPPAGLQDVLEVLRGPIWHLEETMRTWEQRVERDMPDGQAGQAMYERIRDMGLPPLKAMVEG